MAFTRLGLSLLALVGSVVADLQPIEVKGSKFFYKNGTQFFMKGIAYQQDSSAAGGASGESSTTYRDPLANEKDCKRDVPLLKELGINIIRMYAIDPSADHSACMKLLQDAGIYVISDLSEPSLSINRDTPQWNIELFTRYQKVVDELGKYSNVVGFFAGNEVSNAFNNTGASAYVKAAVRDTKAYIKSKSSRWMGVGYACNDDKDIRRQIADYFNCGKAEDAIDYWGYNIYSWCGHSDIKKSGYSDQTAIFSNYSVPVFFAEYGCNTQGGAAKRTFDETAALYGKDMSKVFSGGIVYMFHQEANDYGVVEVKNDKATKMDDFDALQEQLAKADPESVSRDSYNPSAMMASCPAIDKNWEAHSALPPTPDASLCDCMAKSRTCVRSSNLNPKKYGDMFSFICGAYPDICTAINGNATTGVYGAYTMCSDGAKLDYALDAYYNKQNKAISSCDFKGQAGTQKAADESSCRDKLAAASRINAQAATATAPINTPSATQKGGGSLGVPGASLTRVFTLGDYAVGLYMVVAMLLGVGMIAL